MLPVLTDKLWHMKHFFFSKTDSNRVLTNQKWLGALTGIRGKTFIKKIQKQTKKITDWLFVKASLADCNQLSLVDESFTGLDFGWLMQDTPALEPLPSNALCLVNFNT